MTTTTAIIKTERDQREYNYLLQQVGEKRIAEAIASLSGNRKPFVSNIAKLLKIEIPPETH